METRAGELQGVVQLVKIRLGTNDTYYLSVAYCTQVWLWKASFILKVKLNLRLCKIAYKDQIYF